MCLNLSESRFPRLFFSTAMTMVSLHLPSARGQRTSSKRICLSFQPNSTEWLSSASSSWWWERSSTQQQGSLRSSTKWLMRRIRTLSTLLTLHCHSLSTPTFRLLVQTVIAKQSLTFPLRRQQKSKTTFLFKASALTRRSRSFMMKQTSSSQLHGSRRVKLLSREQFLRQLWHRSIVMRLQNHTLVHASLLQPKNKLLRRRLSLETPQTKLIKFRQSATFHFLTLRWRKSFGLTLSVSNLRTLSLNLSRRLEVSGTDASNSIWLSPTLRSTMQLFTT